jgi:hypothetical protein
VSTPHPPIAQRWTAIAGQGTLGASYLPCCVARLVCGSGWDEARARLAFLWSERAAALRFRRAVLAMTARSAESRIALAKLEREASAYEAGAGRLRHIGASRVSWLIGHLRGRDSDPVVGATFSSMSAELAVARVQSRLGDSSLATVEIDAMPQVERSARPA